MHLDGVYGQGLLRGELSITFLTRPEVRVDGDGVKVSKRAIVCKLILKASLPDLSFGLLIAKGNARPLGGLDT